MAEEPGEPSKTKAALARVVQTDTNPQLLKIAKWVRGRLPGDRELGDALSTAGDEPSLVLARRLSELGTERPSATRELGLGALQVWQALSEAQGRGRGQREVAILFTDLVDFSTWALEAGDDAAVELLRAVGRVTESAVADQDGRIVKRLGDGLMATFLSANHAVEAALDAQRAVQQIELDGYRPRMRAGVHWGRPRKLGGDYLGVDVNVAARVADAAKPDQVLISDAVLRRLDANGLRTGRVKRLKAHGAPRDLQVTQVSRGE
jgi:adenylate cyclase